MSNDFGAKALADVQQTPDERNIAIDKVGVRAVKHPITVLDRASETQQTIGEFELTVNLPHHFKGTHMSRFLEVLSDHQAEVSADGLAAMLGELRERLDAASARIVVHFPFFIKKAAPVTHKEGFMEYRCGFDATQNGSIEIDVLVEVPIATLCPCSKEISEYGAHNQRGLATARVRLAEHVWLEELIEIIESCASTPLYPVLKRPDEKFVTEHAYDRPRFVEDVVREIALAFDKDRRIASYEIEVENFESIHAHNAYAQLKR